MPATPTKPATIARQDRLGTAAEALATALALAGVAGHVALALAAITFLAGVIPALL
ncbi:hypothetical protein [Halobaculum gomorrense]|uniref:Uncharacterized protein n=1 Tax=Halobaculum gomorrense TaxID=43928 RepID=A0A1M5M7R9_9EURY|nr:hypothetical protein [Halobaculum gomorrense]SHG73317.1 hypothetical protein SAMN05443636_0914 [Halobaculum gomorrense]